MLNIAKTGYRTLFRFTNMLFNIRYTCGYYAYMFLLLCSYTELINAVLSRFYKVVNVCFMHLALSLSYIVSI